MISSKKMVHFHDPSTFPASERKQQNHCSSKDFEQRHLNVALTRNISDLGGILSAIDVVNLQLMESLETLVLIVDHIQARMQSQPGVEYISHSDRTFLIHLGARLKLSCTDEDERRSSMAYTPGGCASLPCDSSKSRGRLQDDQEKYGCVNRWYCILGLRRPCR